MHEIYEGRLKNAFYLADRLTPEFTASKSLEHIVENILSSEHSNVFGEAHVVESDIKIVRRSLNVDRTELELELPVSGDILLLYVKPTENAPVRQVEGRIYELENCVRVGFYPPDPTELKQQIDDWFQQVSRVVAQLNTEVRTANEHFREQVQTRVAQRLSKISEFNQTIELLPYPLKRKEPPPELMSPLIRREAVRVIIDKNTRSESTTAGYIVPTEEFAYILRVLHDMSSVFESCPETFSKLEEEDLRNILLVALNGHYEGNATGETFNMFGKTDILIRHHSEDIFVAECKIWHGASEFVTAIDQLTNRYIGYKDTRAALIVFSKNKDFTKVIKEIDEAIERHPNYVSSEPKETETERRCIFRNARDSERLFDLAILAFNAPPRE